MCLLLRKTVPAIAAKAFNARHRQRKMSVHLLPVQIWCFFVTRENHAKLTPMCLGTLKYWNRKIGVDFSYEREPSRQTDATWRCKRSWWCERGLRGECSRSYSSPQSSRKVCCDEKKSAVESVLTLRESKQAMTLPFSTWQLLAGWANLHSESGREHVPRWNSRHTSSVSHFVSRMGVTLTAILASEQKKKKNENKKIQTIWRRWWSPVWFVRSGKGSRDEIWTWFGFFCVFL